MTLPYCMGPEFRCLDSVECLQKERAELTRRAQTDEVRADIADIDRELNTRKLATNGADHD